MFLYQNDTQELDIELARWGNESNDAHNADFVNQPGTGANNRMFWTLPRDSLRTTYQIQWTSASVVWAAFPSRNATSDGRGRSSNSFASQVSTYNVPQGVGAMLVHLNLWMFQGKATATTDSIQVIFSDFRFSAASADEARA